MNLPLIITLAKHAKDEKFSMTKANRQDKIIGIILAVAGIIGLTIAMISLYVFD